MTPFVFCVGSGGLARAKGGGSSPLFRGAAGGDEDRVRGDVGPADGHADRAGAAEGWVRGCTTVGFGVRHPPLSWHASGRLSRRLRSGFIRSTVLDGFQTYIAGCVHT